MTIMFTHRYDAGIDDTGIDDAATESMRAPFTVRHLCPAPLSDDVDEIVAYMLLIGDRTVPTRP